MKISTHIEGGYYVIRNKGRVIALYHRWADFNRAMDNLDRVKAQFGNPETKGKR